MAKGQKQAAKKNMETTVNYQRLFTSELGRKVLLDMMIEHNLIGPIFVPGKPDETAFAAGEQNVVYRILKLLKTDVKQMLEYIEQADTQARESIFAERSANA